MNNSITFRPYTASDHAALIGIIREAWHYDRFASPKTAARMARLFSDSCLASQTFTQVAVSGDVPVGIIMAKDRVQHRPTFTGRLRQLRSLAALVAHREGREVMQIFADVHHVDDAACESAYLPALEAAGYSLRVREPDWYAHRMCRGQSPRVNLHIFSHGCEEAARMCAFRDHLRRHPADRDRYAAEKRRLAALPWTYIQDYADTKSAIVQEILAHLDT